MSAQVPLVMALDDPGAVPAVAGGKGASLARLARAGIPRDDPRVPRFRRPWRSARAGAGGPVRC
jgi:hypothetical protein